MEEHLGCFHIFTVTINGEIFCLQVLHCPEFFFFGLFRCKLLHKHVLVFLGVHPGVEVMGHSCGHMF